MNEMVKRLLRSKMVPAFLSVVLGIVLIIARRSALDLLVRVIGYMLLIGAAAFVGMYLFGPHRDPAQIMEAILALIVGFIFVTRSRSVVNFFPIIMGIALILNALSNLTEAMAYPENRMFSGFMSLLVLIFGILILTHPGAMANALVPYVGIFYQNNGILDLIMLHRIKTSLL